MSFSEVQSGPLLAKVFILVEFLEKFLTYSILLGNPFYVICRLLQ